MVLIYPVFLVLALLAVGVGIWLIVRFKHFSRRRAAILLARKLPSLQDLEGQLRQTHEQIERELSDEIKRTIRQIIAEEEDYYSAFLEPFDARGLGQVRDPSQEVDIPAKDDLVYRLDTMQGGSIGLAGLRGVGKTTLLQSICSGSYRNEAVEETIAFWTSAPVKYEARDFILHVFQRLCRALLNNSGVSEEAAAESDVEGRLSVSQVGALRRLLYVFGLGGVTLFAVGVVAALQPESSAAATLNRLLSLLRDPTGDLMLWGGVVGLTASVGYIVLTRLSRMARDHGSALPITLRPEQRDLCVKAIDHLRTIKFQQSYSTGWSGGLNLPLGLTGSLTRAVSLSRRAMSLPEIVDEYRSFVEEITTRESESGEQKLVRMVVIGIDELDKIQDVEDAHKFLNDLKVIFWIRGCFYLLSVSESAMSNFERRGLPVRDAFDSALDRIVHFDYLDLELSKKLLRRRITGRFPVPFICLCYILSGGLPRDLIRVCLDLSRLAPNDAADEQPTIADICNTLVRNDLAAKVRAMRVEASKLPVEPYIDRFLEVLRILESEWQNAQELLDQADHLAGSLTPPRAATKEALEMLAKLEGLRSELRAYVYHLATTAEFFESIANHATGPGDDQGLKKELKGVECNSKGKKLIDLLAKARQSLAVNRYMAETEIMAFRSEVGLPPRFGKPKRKARQSVAQRASSTRAKQATSKAGKQADGARR